MLLCCDLNLLVSSAVARRYHGTIITKLIAILIWWKQEPCLWLKNILRCNNLAWNHLVEMERWDSDEAIIYFLAGYTIASHLIFIHSFIWVWVIVASRKKQRQHVSVWIGQHILNAMDGQMSYGAHNHLDEEEKCFWGLGREGYGCKYLKL